MRFSASVMRARLNAVRLARLLPCVSTSAEYVSEIC